MNNHRSDDARDESAIDREIKAALSVEPSPEFLARVRTRVANEPAPTGWRLPWVFAAAGAVVATIVIAVAVSRSGQRTDVNSIGRAPWSAKVVPEVPVTPPPAVPVEQPRVAESDMKPKRPAIVVSGFSRTEPEVLIDPGEARALRRLLAGIRDRRIDVATLPPELLQPLAAIQPLSAIQPMAPIEPIQPAAQ
jgi:hypothetical protein